MLLSKHAVNVLVDLIENKMAAMRIGSIDDMRAMASLKQCLGELHELRGDEVDKPFAQFDEAPRRGRRPRLRSSSGRF